MSKPIISVSGLRGIVGESLNPVLAARYVLAFSSHLATGSIVMGRDGRETGPIYSDAIAAALSSAGFKVLDADVCATPTVGVLVRETKSVGGIQISASHNPPEYNGIKLFGADGRVISAEEGSKVIESYEQNQANFVTYDRVGRRERLADTVSAHLDRVLETVSVEAIRDRRFKVVLDSNHGAGSVVAKKLFEALNCDFQILGDSPDGQFEHVPEPTAENLQSVAVRAKKFGADVVFCQDPDADRLAIIDENGRYIGEEYTLAITLRHALRKSANAVTGRQRCVVINCATSRMSIDIAHAHNATCRISAVGEANVTGEMLAHAAVYGGEGNGGPIDPRVGYVRDSFVAMAQTLDAMAAENRSISELVQEIPAYSIVKAKVSLAREKIESVFSEIESQFDAQDSSRLDGLRLDFESAWLLVRASNTEPIVRVIAEAKSNAEAESLVERAKSVIASCP